MVEQCLRPDALETNSLYALTDSYATSNQSLSCFCCAVILLKNLLVLVCGAKATRAIVMFFGNPRMRVI